MYTAVRSTSPATSYTRPLGAPEPDSLTLRQRMLAAAKQCFAGLTYDDATLPRIAQAAGVPLAELQRQFVDKLTLLLAVFDDVWGLLNQRLGEIVATSLSARDAVLSILAVLLRNMERDGDLARLLSLETHTYATNPKAGFSKGYRRFVSFCGELALRGEQDGSLTGTWHPEIVAALLIGAAETVMRYRMAAAAEGGMLPSASAQLALAFDMVVAGLKS